jgi:hypothetical protein
MFSDWIFELQIDLAQVFIQRVYFGFHATESGSTLSSLALVIRHSSFIVNLQAS